MDVTKESVVIGTAVPTAIANPMPEFHTGLCNCPSGMGICCQTMFCWLCTTSNMMNAIDYGNAVCSCGACCTIMCCCGIDLYFLAGLRRIVIQRYGIQGEALCSSCLKASCCQCCNSCQLQREMGARGQHNNGTCASPDTPQMAQGFPAPAAPGAMGQPNASTALWPPMKPPGQWSSGFCSCGCPECIEIMCCQCFITGYVSGKLQSMLDGSDESFSTCACLGACCCNHCPCHNFMARREVIERYNIQGESVCNTWCYSMCGCTSCLIAQARREMGFRGEFPGGLLMKEHPTQ